VIAALTVVIGCHSAVAAPVSRPDPVGPDPVGDLDEEFRLEYGRARLDALSHVGPLIEVYEGDKLVLVRAQQHVEQSFTRPSDAVLKTMAHVPVGIFALLSTIERRPISEDGLAKIRRYRERISATHVPLVEGGLSPSTTTRQQRILDASTQLLDRAVERNEVDENALLIYERRMAPLMMENVSEVAQAQIDAINAQVTKWRHELSADEWRRLHVVVMGIHMARDGELATQYFVRLLGEPGEGRRVVYAEGIWEESLALDLLATHVMDGRTGEAFFGYDLRMHRDVFADAARKYLDRLGIGR
jgi:hypothetical protein